MPDTIQRQETAHPMTPAAKAWAITHMIDRGESLYWLREAAKLLAQELDQQERKGR